jgi:hypothetical protein
MALITKIIYYDINIISVFASLSLFLVLLPLHVFSLANVPGTGKCFLMGYLTLLFRVLFVIIILVEKVNMILLFCRKGKRSIYHNLL